jgi:hypothetical protein
MNANAGLRVPFCISFVMLMSALTGCAVMSEENVAKSHDQCLQNGGAFYAKVIACDIAIDSRKYSGKSLADLHFMKGVHQQHDNRNYEAIATFNEALKLNPNDSEAHYFRGLSLQSIGNLTEAQQDFDTAQQLKNQPELAQAVDANQQAIEQERQDQERRDRERLEQERERNQPVVPANDAPHIDGQQALSPGETNAVIQWIARKVAADRQPFCYRDSYGRTAGTPLGVCGPNEEKNGLLCYPRCDPGYSGAGPVCWQRCPEGFNDIGVSCAKPAGYGRGAGYPWKFGDALNDKGMFKRCEKQHGRGNCEKYGAIVYPKCKSGFHAFGSNVCTPTCLEGMRDDGAFCAKHSYGRGAGNPMECAAGTEQDGALCYPTCRPGFHGVGPVCWQTCSAGRTACGAGCAASSQECANDTTTMVVAPATLAMNIVSGSAVGGQLLAKYRNVKKALEIHEKVSRVTDTISAASDVRDTTQLWVDEYVGSFSTLTSPEVVREIDRHFTSQDSRRWIEQQYALNHLGLMLQSDLGQTRHNTLDALSGLDPIGVTGVVSAFDHPICSLGVPFPQVHPYY